MSFAAGSEGVCGGTASGKTTVCDAIIQQLHDHRVALVNQVWLLLPLGFGPVSLLLCVRMSLLYLWSLDLFRGCAIDALVIWYGEL